MGGVKRPITILFDAHPLLGQKTGVGYYTNQLITNLAKRFPNEIKLVGYYHNFFFRKTYPDITRASNIRYRRIACVPGQVVNALRRIGIGIPIELLTWTKPDFIFYTNFWGPPSGTRATTVPFIYDLSFCDHPSFGADKNTKDLNRFVPKAINKSGFAVTISEFSRKRISKTYKTSVDRIIVTPIPPVEAIFGSEKRIKETHEKLKITKPFLLFVGTLEPRKNLLELLLAFEILPKSISKHYSLIIAGKTDWKFEKTINKIQEMVAEGYDIKYLGYIDEKIRNILYQSCSLFVLPSIYEGFGMPILEALSYGAPCVVSDIPVFHEVAQGYSDYYSLGAVSDLGRKITLALKKDSPENRKKRIEYAASLSSWNKVCERIYAKMTT